MNLYDRNSKPNKKLNPKKYDVMQWRTQAGNITTNLKIKINLLA